MIYLTVFIVGLAAFVAMGFLRSRRALRDLWQKHEELAELMRESDRQRWEAQRSLANFSLRQGNATPGIANEALEVHAQHGEDVWVFNYFQGKTDGVFIEVGAYDGLSFSNTAFLESVGWKGLCVEANPKVADRCRENRPNSTVVNAAVGSRDGTLVQFEERVDEPMLSAIKTAPGDEAVEGPQTDAAMANTIIHEVPMRSLTGLGAEHGLNHIDFLSIDVEGAEIDVLQGLEGMKMKPEMLMLEAQNATASAALHEYLGPKGYRFVCRLGCNEVFVKIAAPLSPSS